MIKSELKPGMLVKTNESLVGWFMVTAMGPEDDNVLIQSNSTLLFLEKETKHYQYQQYKTEYKFLFENTIISYHEEIASDLQYLLKNLIEIIFDD